ncbi:MAG: enoyl-CoA hydratase/isomerase family protein [Oligoflexia bacterium]|nr:enoyl-CoA hydratase/isomerase family protein [Oligoflexia bacterium]
MNAKFLTFTWEIKEQIVYIGFNEDRLDNNIFTELEQAIMLIQDDRTIDGLVFYSHHPAGFLSNPTTISLSLSKSITDHVEKERILSWARRGEMLLNTIEDLNIPTISCVDGACLGEGLEFALSTRYLLLSTSTQTILAFPSIELGLIPTFGGTYRLLERLSLPDALKMVISGRSLDTQEALRIGLATDAYHQKHLLKMAHNIIQRPKFFNKTQDFKQIISDFLKGNFLSKRMIYQRAKNQLMEQTGGLHEAPLKALELMEIFQDQGRATYLHQESQVFTELYASYQSKNLRYLLSLKEELQKRDKQSDTTGTLRPPQRCAVIGGGTTGGELINLLALGHSCPSVVAATQCPLTYPILKDLNYESLEVGLKHSSSIFANYHQQGKISKDEWESRQRSIIPVTNYQGFKLLDLVIESIFNDFDDIEIKKRLFQEIESNVAEKTLLVTNTSFLSTREIASALQHPERFAGLHCFYPLDKTSLIELVAHPEVATDTLTTLSKWVWQLGKIPLIVQDSPGFLVNRLIWVYVNEAFYLLEEGVKVDEIERAALNFGMAMGPMRFLDQMGFPFANKLSKLLTLPNTTNTINTSAAPTEHFARSALLNKIFTLTLPGKNGGQGFYLYTPSSEEYHPPSFTYPAAAESKLEINPVIKDLLPAAGASTADAVATATAAAKNTNHTITMDERTIQMRLVLPMINEAAYILDEGVVKDASVLDLGAVYGAGFPAFRGGILRYADHSGLPRILQAIQEFEKNVNQSRYSPSPLLKKLASEDKSFY